MKETLSKGTLTCTLDTSLLTSQCAPAVPLPSVDFLNVPTIRELKNLSSRTRGQLGPLKISFSSVLTFSLCVPSAVVLLPQPFVATPTSTSLRRALAKTGPVLVVSFSADASLLSCLF